MAAQTGRIAVIPIREYDEGDRDAIRRVHQRKDLRTATETVEITETGRYADAT